MADVYFDVGADLGAARKFPAHKYVLATGSTVFYAMFYGGLAEERDVIEVNERERGTERKRENQSLSQLLLFPSALLQSIPGPGC